MRRRRRAVPAESGQGRAAEMASELRASVQAHALPRWYRSAAWHAARWRRRRLQAPGQGAWQRLLTRATPVLSRLSDASAQAGQRARYFYGTDAARHTRLRLPGPNRYSL